MVYPIGKIVVVPFYKLWLRKFEGLENVPKELPCIIAANHSSYYDALLLPSIIIPKIDKKIHAFVNSIYWKNSITRWFVEWGESIPVYIGKDKDSKEKNEHAFKKALYHLKHNGIVQIFPEGTRSYDGRLKKAYAGVAKLALEAKVPVLPVGIIGANEVLPKGKILPRFKRCEVKIGKLIYFQKYYNRKGSKKIYEEITRTIMKEIARLIGQEYRY